MSPLLDLQRRMASAVMQPITKTDRMARRDPQGRSNAKEAKEFIKPNSRLTSFERLEIYNRQYWFRILDSFAEDFPGLRAVVGRKRFDVRPLQLEHVGRECVTICCELTMIVQPLRQPRS